MRTLKITSASKIIKTYSELISIPTYLGRYQYLRIKGKVGEETFGHDRFLNQALYHKSWWLTFRNDIIVRDNGCDMGMPGYEIPKGAKILIHHINPITIQDIIDENPMVMDPENVISVTLNTHNAIHYGDETMLITEVPERRPFDTCPWRK